MKKIVLFIVFSFSISFAQSDNKSCETIKRISNLIEANHYKPKAIDDSLSVFVFDTFIESLDENSTLFIQSEYDSIVKYRYQIDDFLNQSNCSFLADFYTIYNKNLNRKTKLVEKVKSELTTSSVNDSIEFSKNRFPYSKTENELFIRFKKRIAFDILKDVSEISKNKDSIVANFETIYKNSRIKIFEAVDCELSNSVFSVDEFNSKFYTVFCSYFDPHTEYFSPSEKSGFMSSVSSDNYSFGLLLSLSNSNIITVDDIYPGSSAYKSEKIKSGDILLKIIANNQEINVLCSSMKQIETVISTNTYVTAEFTFRKKSGEIYTVELTKELQKNYDTTVYSYVIVENGVKMGYIKIPSFYSTFEDGLSNVSDDVYIEIAKLESENISGIVLDLQNNGGGSMREAIKLTSIFIPKGPIAVFENKKNKLETIKIPNNALKYYKPMVVLVNGFSASASEFFTNAIKDYNRAIIVGNTTFGKATMQQFFPLTYDNQSFVKLTIEEFFSVSGQTNQNTGIVPDINIPFLFDKQSPREQSYQTAIANSSLRKKTKYKKLTISQKEAIVSRSNARLNSDEFIIKTIELNDEINQLYENKLPTIALNFDSVYNQVQQINSLWKKLELFYEKEHETTILNTMYDINELKDNTFLLKLNSDKIKSIKQNIQIIEASKIMSDMIINNSK